MSDTTPNSTTPDPQEVTAIRATDAASDATAPRTDITLDQLATASTTDAAPDQLVSASSTARAVVVPEPAKVPEARRAYGTAKTENLRDSGWWRIVLPAFVIVMCLALFAVPLVILAPLLATSLSPLSASVKNGTPLTWMWIVMIVIVVTLAIVIVRGVLKIFLTQAGNYRR